MKIKAEEIWRDLTEIRDKSPLVHNITNYVVMNITANALLSLGASPVMAHAEEEVEEMAGIAQALVVNIGTLSSPWIRGMEKAMRRASELNKPVVFDPAGNGATGFRTETCRSLLEKTRPSIIRGNGSEVQALVSSGLKTKGVDSTLTADSAFEAAAAAGRLLGCTVCVSGSRDYIVKGKETAVIHNGSSIMTRVTGLGCTASALCGAFSAVNPSSFLAAAHAMAVMGIAGEIAGEKAASPAAFQAAFLDTLYTINEKEIRERLKTGEL